ncbi:MAG: helix-turn-helix domain-containing protein [Balneolaceae bacterium]
MNHGLENYYTRFSDSIGDISSCSLNSMQDLLANFESLNKLNVCILLKGPLANESSYKEELFLRRIGHSNQLCALIKSSPYKKGCDGYDQIVRMGKAEKSLQPFIDECPHGVIELILPLRVHEKFIGTIFCGPILKYNDKNKSCKEVYDKVKSRGTNKDSLFKIIKELPYFDEKEILILGELLNFSLLYLAQGIDDLLIERDVLIKQNALIKDTLEIINKSEKIPTQKEIAKRLGISPQYLCQLFNKVMKKNFSTYVNMIRVNRAQDLLKFTRLTITDIATVVGIENDSYFSKIFKQLTGVTPTEYRKSSSLIS